MTQYAFRGLSFDVVMDGPIAPEWFESKTDHTVDLVLGGSTRYVDIGGVAVQPLTVVMQFRDSTNRTTMQTYRGLTGTLADDNGRSATVLLSDLTPIRVRSTASGVYRLSATFEYVSA